MAGPFIGEIKVFSFNFPPRGWAFCNGQLMPIIQNQALFSILGTTYGGDGRVTFGLPNLQGSIPVHAGNGIALGERGGETSHTLSVAEMPAHSHIPSASGAVASSTSAVGHLWASAGADPYGSAPNAAMNSACALPVGGGQPHDNMPPYSVVIFCIALTGLFPSLG
jgi:microcystin-dependent protein